MHSVRRELSGFASVLNDVMWPHETRFFFPESGQICHEGLPITALNDVRVCGIIRDARHGTRHDDEADDSPVVGIILLLYYYIV